MLGTNFAAKTSTLYNISFCLVPTPALESKFALPGIVYNLHSAEGEGDGGSAYTIFINHQANPQTYHVARINGKTIQPLVDISEYVDNDQGGVYAGGSAFCATSLTMWVAVHSLNPGHDILLTIDVNNRKVVGNVSIPKPALASHFADCASNSVGGVTQTPPNKQGVSNVVLGMLDDRTGAFTKLDSVPLPAGSTLKLSGIADYLDDPRWNFTKSSYGAILLTDGKMLPGALFTSTAGRMGPGKTVPVNVAVAGIAVAY
jgi:hypothetical protein